MSVDLRARYLGLELASPLVASASPLTGNLDDLRRLEDAGAAAVVLPSLFEEQIEHEELSAHHLMMAGADLSAEARGFFPELEHYGTGPDRYLELVADAKAALGVPVMASLNGHSPGGWTHMARLIEEAGADAIELNVYFLAADVEDTPQGVEQRYLDLVGAVRAEVRVPVAVKVSPFFSAMANMARRLESAGADGLVLFNRFLQPDIALDELEVAPRLVLSSPDELRLALRWIAILRGRVGASLAATGGAHAPEDVLKLLLAGADCVMLASCLLRHGPGHLRTLREGVERWMAAREYDSVRQLTGSLSQASCPHPDAFERANYMKVLRSFTGS